jgi:hypothetical protein
MRTHRQECPTCGQPIEFPGHNVGYEIPCPGCESMLVLEGSPKGRPFLWSTLIVGVVVAILACLCWSAGMNRSRENAIRKTEASFALAQEARQAQAQAAALEQEQLVKRERAIAVESERKATEIAGILADFKAEAEKRAAIEERNRYQAQLAARAQEEARILEQKRLLALQRQRAIQTHNRQVAEYNRQQEQADIDDYNRQVAEYNRQLRLAELEDQRQQALYNNYVRTYSARRRSTVRWDTSGSAYDPNSLANPYGAGSPYKADGLMNPYSQYGSPYSNKSWKNPYATDAPKLYDADGNYHGKLSSNPYDPDSTSNPYGRFGSQYSSDSINNPYGAGNPYSSKPIYVVPSP